MKTKLKRISIILVVLATIILPAFSLGRGEGGFSGQGSSQPLKKLKEVEVRQYHGKNLSSIGDFRENSIKGPQYVDKESYRLTVKGLVDRELSLPYDDIVSLDNYEKVVTLHCVEGWSVKILWQGVLVRDILKKAGPKNSAKIVILRAVDGYSTSFPLEYFMNNDIIIAYKINGVVLPPERGFPFQLVAEDKWGYKWIKWIKEIELSDNENFRGYWERYGYSQKGDFNEPMFDNR